MDKERVIKVIEKYLEYLKANKYDVKKAYLFGSYANNRYNEDSDIDLAIVMSKVSNSFLLQMKLMKLGRKIDSRIEPHPFDVLDFKKTNPFVSEIIRKGVQVV